MRICRTGDSNADSVALQHNKASAEYLKLLDKKADVIAKDGTDGMLNSSSYLLMLPHGHDAGHDQRCRQFGGIFGTFIALCMVGFGVYICIDKEKEINDWFTYGTALILVFTKSVIPYAVKMCVEFEGYTDPDFKTKQVLLRVYFLKMAQLVVLLMSFENVQLNPDGTGDQLCQSTTAGVTMYKLIITNGLVAMATKPATFFAWKCWFGVSQSAT